MVRYMSIEEQVDKDFSVARRRAFLRRMKARLRNAPHSNQRRCFNEVRAALGANTRTHLGRRVVEVAKIAGSVGRCSEFDEDFLPTRASVETKWKRIDRAFHRGEELPPVSLYKLEDSYFVLDGNHRVSVARYHGVEWIDAEVTEFLVPASSGTGVRCRCKDRSPLARTRRQRAKVVGQDESARRKET